jgi:2-hydroxychromene-2-carboxylate isomerase
MIELPCFYSLSSPWAYFMGPALEDIVRRHKVKLILKPFDFQEIVPRTGGVPLRTRPPARRSYHEEELDRWRTYLQMPLALKPKYYPEKVTDPDWNKRPGWMVIAAQQRGLDAFRLSHALLRALWAEERDTAAAEVRIAVAEENGMDGRTLHQAETSAEVQAAYRAYTSEAEALGVFGAPTFIVEGKRYWGQDRLGFVDRALDALRARQGLQGR